VRAQIEALVVVSLLLGELYGVQVGALETQELRMPPVPFARLLFSDTVKGPATDGFRGWDGC
jgi:hypothetical protein